MIAKGVITSILVAVFAATALLARTYDRPKRPKRPTAPPPDVDKVMKEKYR